MEKIRHTFCQQQPKVTVCATGRIVICLNGEMKSGSVLLGTKSVDGYQLEEIEGAKLEMWEYDVYWLTSSEFAMMPPDMDIESFALQTAKEEILAEITAYDSSLAVNSFTLNGKVGWLDKATRVGLQNSISILKEAGQDKMLLWVGDKSINTTCDSVRKFLSELELYAVACCNTTETHKQTVANMDDIEKVVTYDYKSGYPDKLDYTV